MEKKSIADLLAAKKKPSVAQIEEITAEVHKAAPTPSDDTKKIMRISVNASVDLYLKSKSKATRQGMTLMAYILKLMEEDTKDVA